MVGRSVEQYIQAGVAAFHIEDQVVNKRCGHLNGKEVVDEKEWLSRIRAAVNARARSGRDIVIIARTDAMQSQGYESAISRLQGALKLGADVAFLEAIESKEQAKQAIAELAPHPVLLNMVDGGVTPHIGATEAKELGFKMIIFPGMALAPVYKGVMQACKELKETGDLKPLSEGSAVSPKDIFITCGLKELMKFDMEAGGESYGKGV